MRHILCLVAAVWMVSAPADVTKGMEITMTVIEQEHTNLLKAGAQDRAYEVLLDRLRQAFEHIRDTVGYSLFSSDSVRRPLSGPEDVRLHRERLRAVSAEGKTASISIYDLVGFRMLDVPIEFRRQFEVARPREEIRQAFEGLYEMHILDALGLLFDRVELGIETRFPAYKQNRAVDLYRPIEPLAAHFILLGQDILDTIAYFKQQVQCRRILLQGQQNEEPPPRGYKH